MKEWKSKNNEMYLWEWYDIYLMKYVSVFSQPKYNHEMRKHYTKKLLEWYENWNGYMEEVIK